MARGNGTQAQKAKSSGKLSAYVKPKDGSGDMSTGSEFVDWGEVNYNLIAGAIMVAVKEGGALLFGCSRDKTCYSVKVYDGGDGTAYYFACTPNGLVELETFLRGIIELGDY